MAVHFAVHSNTSGAARRHRLASSRQPCEEGIGFALTLHMQEGVFVGNQAEGEILKSLITTERLLIEPKGLEPFEIDSYLRVGITSNCLSAVPATADERRFAIYECGPRWPDEHYFKLYRERM